MSGIVGVNYALRYGFRRGKNYRLKEDVGKPHDKD